jgi:hypothetical protein
MDFRRFYKFYAYACGFLFVLVIFTIIFVSKMAFEPGAYIIPAFFLLAAYYFSNNAKGYENEIISQSEKK